MEIVRLASLAYTLAMQSPRGVVLQIQLAVSERGIRKGRKEIGIRKKKGRKLRRQIDAYKLYAHGRFYMELSGAAASPRRHFCLPPQATSNIYSTTKIQSLTRPIIDKHYSLLLISLSFLDLVQTTACQNFVDQKILVPCQRLFRILAIWYSILGLDAMLLSLKNLLLKYSLFKNYVCVIQPLVQVLYGFFSFLCTHELQSPLHYVSFFVIQKAQM